MLHADGQSRTGFCMPPDSWSVASANGRTHRRHTDGGHRRVIGSAVIANRVMSYFEVRPRASAASLSPVEAAGPLIEGSIANNNYNVASRAQLRTSSVLCLNQRPTTTNISLN